ncbi:MAG: thioredoxin domain-containing protein [Acidobacteria bacterium]|nr:thioredoxin domain-containing protein [Acidobacteriota bacterium]MBV9144756.1 thioredoxin domain-containing protein [Acidobacteriota bacterium]
MNALRIRTAFVLSVVIMLGTLALAQSSSAKSTSAGPHPQWVGWSDDVFQQAKAQNRFVLLDLEAVWCHWCHVMDENTYKDARVLRLLGSRYIAVKVDQDSRPDLSNRYEDYGWPATVVFNGEGKEIVKRQGYLDPDEMASLLKAIIDDPTPGPSVRAEAKLTFAENPVLATSSREALRRAYAAQYDAKQGGWGFNDKFLDADSVEYAMLLAQLGDKAAGNKARTTLNLQHKYLIDPIWGGAYQYSAEQDWVHPHFEKIASIQANDLRIFALAYAQYRDPEYLAAAKDIHRFLVNFMMSPEGAFYVSQDADLIEGHHSADYFALNDAERRKQGVPRVDKHLYARENGWIVDSLCALYAASGDTAYLDEATRAANWVIANRALPDGGFSHDAKDSAGPYLGDNIAMARAFEMLYSVTGDRQWLKRAEETMQFVSKTFNNGDVPGYLTSKAATNAGYKPHPQRDENILVVRTANLLYHYTGKNEYTKLAAQAMRYVGSPQIANTFPAAGALIADYEFTHAPAHLAVVGHKDDSAAGSLFLAMLKLPGGYKRVEWWDDREGPLPHAEVEYPPLDKAAAFVCSERTCSKPIFAPEEIESKVQESMARSVEPAMPVRK